MEDQSSGVSREQIQERLKDKQALNKHAYMDLLRMGSQLDPTHMMMVRVDTLMELILTEEQKELFELAFETKLAGLIEDAKLDARRGTITPELMKPGIIRPHGS